MRSSTAFVLRRGSCEICMLRDATRTCPSCGRRVCDDDWDDERGVCKVCAETTCEICRRRPAIGYCRVCGRVGCEDCLIEESPVSYICVDCARALGRSRA
ncbi:MAG: hypothetical protein ABWK00_01620 [Desulfurococcaceae archaeon]